MQDMITGSFSFTAKTANAGTAITQLIPPRGRRRIKVTQCDYSVTTNPGHVLYFMNVLDKVTLKAAAASADTTLLLSRMPGAYSQNASADGQAVPSVSNNNISSGDYISYQQADGTWAINTAGNATLNANGTVSLADIGTAVSAAGISNGTTIFFHGLGTDTNPRTGLANDKLTFGSTNNVTLSFPSNSSINVSSIAESPRQREPMIVLSNNTSAAGTLERLSGVYGR